MIRSAKAKDYWRDINKTNKYKYLIEDIKFDGIYGFEKVTFKKGINAICGLNGAGKSTIVSFLKDVIGIPLNEADNNKINQQVIQLKLSKPEISLCSNTRGERLSDKIDDEVGIFIDYQESLRIMDFFMQTNLDELLEQYEKFEYTEDMRDEISYLIGKDYDQIELIEVDDEISRPYFIVNSCGVEYRSVDMGIGEHFIFYAHWLLRRMHTSDIVIIEEPETFVSINSQKNLMNYLAKLACKNGIIFIITTHSPFILDKVDVDNISIISKFGSSTTVINPESKEAVLEQLGLHFVKEGIIYFEDDVALFFFKRLISQLGFYNIKKKYDLEIVDGESGISNMLKYPKTLNFKYRIVGVYDGDMIERIEKIKDKFAFEYYFLPSIIGVEKSFKKIITSYPNLLEKSYGKEDLIGFLSTIAGEEPHDWLIELEKKLAIGKNELVSLLTDEWMELEENKENIKMFCDNITKLLI